MIKKSTPIKNSVQKYEQKNIEKLQPQKQTLDNIMKFASTYRVEKLNQNQFISLNLN